MTRHTSQDCRTIQQLECTTLKKKQGLVQQHSAVLFPFYLQQWFQNFIPVSYRDYVVYVRSQIVWYLRGLEYKQGTYFWLLWSCIKPGLLVRHVFFFHSILELGMPCLKEVTFFIVIVKLRPSTKALLSVRQLRNCHQLGMEFLVRSSIEQGKSQMDMGFGKRAVLCQLT